MIKYEDILDVDKISKVFNDLSHTSRHKRKITVFSLYYVSNIISIYNELKDRKYIHDEYNVFIIHEPKERVIMSEKLHDKIVNQLFSKYILYPLLEPKLIYSNVATREGKGSKLAYDLMKKYINKIKINNPKVYALKMDISKYFPSISHDILKKFLRKDIEDDDIYDLSCKIIDSTNTGLASKIYRQGYGLPIGNMSSQIFAIYYLSSLDHYIKEVLREKCMIRYMDDLIILSGDKERLKYDLKCINKFVRGLELKLNSKTCILDLNRGVDFLGYRYILNGKRLIIKPRKSTYYRMKRRIKRGQSTIENYNGYLVFCNVNVKNKLAKYDKKINN